MTYLPRTYRETMRQGRFNSFVVSYKQTDLWIGLNPIETSDELKTFALNELKKLWDNLENCICRYPIIQKSLSPIEIPENVSPEMEIMIKAGNRAGIGPMSAVAGFTSEYIGRKIEKKYKPTEIIVENGGDIYLNAKEPITLSIYAGDSPLSEKIGVKIPVTGKSCGICTSSGKVGPSLSSGNADAVMIACENAALADAFATAYGNKVKTASDIETVLAETEKFTEILSAIVICDDKIGIRGKFEVIAL